jgi:hypothetical protein
VPLADDAFTIGGMVVGFALWLGLCYAVYRWGPFEDGSLGATLKAVVAKARGR